MVNDAGAVALESLETRTSMLGSVPVHTSSPIVADGRAQWDALKAQARRHKVFLGSDDGVSALMRFVKAKVVIHKGERVKFLNTRSMGTPHTVTFGKIPVGLAFGLLQP